MADVLFVVTVVALVVTVVEAETFVVPLVPIMPTVLDVLCEAVVGNVTAGVVVSSEPGSPKLKIPTTAVYTIIIRTIIDASSAIIFARSGVLLCGRLGLLLFGDADLRSW